MALKLGIVNNQSWISSFNAVILNTKKLYPEAIVIIVFKKLGDSYHDVYFNFY